MSQVARHKHVMRELWMCDELLSGDQQIARIGQSRGNNLHEAEGPDGPDIFLVSMPQKFRRNHWIKRGSFVIVEPIEEGKKVRAEIIRILRPDDIKELTKSGLWPSKFMQQEENRTNEDGVEVDNGLFTVRHFNRRVVEISSSESSDDED